MDVERTIDVPTQLERLSHAAVAVGSYLFITGGHNGTRYCDDLLLLNLGEYLSLSLSLTHTHTHIYIYIYLILTYNV